MASTPRSKCSAHGVGTNLVHGQNIRLDLNKVPISAGG